NTTVSVVAVVTDAEQDSDTLDARLLSSEDGTLWTGNPDSDGTVSVDWDSLSLGLHTLSLSAEDAEGNIGVDMVSVLIVENAAPSVYISYPLTGSMHWTTDSVLFEAEVSDDLLDPGELFLSWESDVDGTLSTTAADSDGFSTITAELTEDAHVVTLWVEDDQGNLGSDSIVVDVVDPLNYDDDGDGVTENEGDCDDEDDTVSPDEEEVCGDMDNDCDDEVNEDDMDAYESNDSVASAYSLGEVDGMLWASETITVSGLTFHNEDDIDGFYWDAEEDWFENVEVDVTVTGLPSSGDYVLELYLDSSLQDSDSGSGTLTVDYEGSIWDDGESDFTILIYPASSGWPSASCDVTYDVEIISHNDSLL
ncbi:MAG: putative metal-binding motif-containing protein, partial [Myxococcota bacterium]|nr:putative metal-binding motif-containing protein [Myxococcota bacterium]